MSNRNALRGLLLKQAETEHDVTIKHSGDTSPSPSSKSEKGMEDKNLAYGKGDGEMDYEKETGTTSKDSDGADLNTPKDEMHDKYPGKVNPQGGGPADFKKNAAQEFYFWDCVEKVASQSVAEAVVRQNPLAARLNAVFSKTAGQESTGRNARLKESITRIVGAG
jgi:hypothetical protein